MRVLVAHDKHGLMLYVSALACLRHRIDTQHFYYADEADEALAAYRAGEQPSQRFLDKRKDHEYERVVWQEVCE